MSAQPYKFEGWLGHDAAAVEGNMQWGSYDPKPWEETDVDIRITHCGICGTDVHMLRSGWGKVPYPIAVGHEIVGVAVRVGSKASTASHPIRIGDRVGVGAQSDSCGTCADCASGDENFCDDFVTTYGSFFKQTGAKSMGGFARYSRVPGRFVVRIPDGLDGAAAAPMLCGGVTVWSPLVHFGGRDAPPSADLLKGLSVGVVGVGGLGHFAVLFARALGADKVVGISRSGSKRADALRLGCDSYIATAEDKDWVRANFKTLDLIISTVSSSTMPMKKYMRLLKRDGTLCQVGNPDDGDLTIPAGAIISQRLNLTGSCVGSPQEMRDMLQFAAEQKIRPWIEERPMSDANQAIVDLEKGKPRYRYVLVNDWDRANL